MLRVGNVDSQLLEIKTVRESIRIARGQKDLQSSLNRAIYASKLAESAAATGLRVEGVTQYDMAKILWDQSETVASIQMLRQIHRRSDNPQQAIPISKPDLLADLVGLSILEPLIFSQQ